MTIEHLELVLELIRMTNGTWTGDRKKFEKKKADLKESVERELQIKKCLDNNFYEVTK